MSGFWDFNFGDIFPAAVTTGVGLTSALLSNSVGQDNANAEREFAASQSDKEFARQKELIQLQASLRGGGAKPPGPFTGFTDPQRVQAMQGQDQLGQNAIQNIIAAYQRALLGG